ncbi:nickel-dependent hydrogenase large subunit [Candidatus Micrarchaeota archaeon]|nr:nickel-dependent hydrogenase large subunit [Candidatus Micrarchaeota archaeon]
MHRTMFPIGPQHPSLKEPIFLKLYVEGTVIEKAEFDLGYAHRGVEEKMENKEIDTTLHAVQRTCGICSQCHSLAFLNAVEPMGQIRIPKRVALQRMVIAELERIHSHMLWSGVMMHEMGLETLFMYYMREREKILDVFDELTGNRVHHSADLIGTMKMNFSEEDIEMISKTFDSMKDKLEDYRRSVEGHDVIRDRCIGKGKITRADAVKYGLVGPVARASGISYDVRVNAPYLGYQFVKVNPVVRTEGDVHARTLVRLDETFESMRIVEEACSKIPKSKVPKYPVKRIFHGQGAGRVEAPRGENFHFVKIDMAKTKRVKIRTPTVANLVMYPKVLQGADITDAPVIVMSMDPCISCMERVAVIKKGKTEVWSSHELFRGKKHD